MDNLRLITILPTQGPQGVTQPTAAQGTTAQGLAPVLAGLPAGSILSGYIINRDTSGNPILRTERGDVTFASQFFLKIGSEVVIRVEHLAGQLRAHILSVNGQPPEIAAQQSAFEGDPEVIVGRESSPAPAQRQTPQAPAAAVSTSPASSPSSTVTGTLLPPPPGQPTAPLPPGTQIALRLVSIAVPDSPSGAPPVPPPAAAIPASYTAYARAAASAEPGVTTATPATVASQTAPPPAAPPTTPGTPVAQATAPLAGASTAAATTTPAAAAPLSSASAASIIASASTQQATTSSSTVALPVQPGQLIQAAVIGHEPSGEIVVQTPVGPVRLPPGIQLPPASQATFEIIAIAPQAAQTRNVLSPAPVAAMAHGWESLRNIITLLTEGATLPPPGALPLLLKSDAQGGPAAPDFSTGLLLFIVALKGGSFRQWLGEENVRWLEDRGHTALLKGAEADFAGLARRFAETPPQHWQPLFFPVAAAGGDIQQGRLFIKRDRRKDAGGRPGRNEDTRFILEVSLTQLGEMQMDGFVRRHEKDLEFDLIVRSLAPLSTEIKDNILKIYNETGELAGYRGHLSFQPVREFPIHPMEELIAEHISSVIA